MGPVIGHVGNRVSALVDGQVPAETAERLWAHVHGCRLCRDLVEREGWVKTRVAGLSHQSRPAPDYLASLLSLEPSPMSTSDGFPPLDRSPLHPHRRRATVAAVVGAGSVGAAVLGVLAMTGPVADRPAERGVPLASLAGTSEPSSAIGLGVSLAAVSQPSARQPSVPAVSVDDMLVPVMLIAARGFLGPALANEWVTINP